VRAFSARTLLSGLIAWVGFCVALPFPCGAQSFPPASRFQQPIPTKQKPATTNTFTSSLKKSMNELGRMLRPKTPDKPADDPISLSSKAKPTAELHTAVAHVHEETHKLSEAAAEYEKALQLTPDYLGALLGLARVNDRLGRTQAAAKLYDRAARAHPNKASAHNNFALFHARHGEFSRSVVAFLEAVRLEPENRKYRNNIAAVLVQMGRNKQAFEHLRAVHGPAVAYYNLGYLLEKKGETVPAIRHFAAAARLDPSLLPARSKLAALQRSLKQAGHPVAGGGEPPPRSTPPMPPGLPPLKRLPPPAKAIFNTSAPAPMPPGAQHWPPTATTPARSPLN